MHKCGGGSSGNKANLSQPAKLELGLGLSLAKKDLLVATSFCLQRLEGVILIGLTKLVLQIFSRITYSLKTQNKCYQGKKHGLGERINVSDLSIIWLRYTNCTFLSQKFHWEKLKLGTIINQIGFHT